MLPEARLDVQSLPLIPSESEVSEVAIATAFNSNVQITARCPRQLPDSGERPEHSLDEQQITALKPDCVKTELVKSPNTFQENDLLLVYPCNSVDRGDPSLNLKNNPKQLKKKLYNSIGGFLYEEWIKNKRKNPPAQEEKKSLTDSILARLPAELTEFLNKDWSGKEFLAPDEYQALAKFHSAIISLECDDLEYQNDKNEEEFEQFYIKECLPLRAGWSEEEIKLIEFWLNEALRDCQRYPDEQRMKEYIKTCHYGIFKAHCVTVCDDCIFRVIENRESYEFFKILMGQGKVLQ